MMPGKQLCPRCGGILTFRDEYQRWFCYTCQRSLGLLPKKSKRAIALGITLLVVCGCILPSVVSAVLYIWISGFTPIIDGGVPPTEGGPVVPAPTASLVCTSSTVGSTHYYNISVISITQSVSGSDVNVSISGYGSVKLSYTCNYYYPISTGVYIYIKWLDNDYNYELSSGDLISIKTSGISLAGKTFSLVYTGSTIGYLTLI